jgi:GAF domain-containing protein
MSAGIQDITNTLVGDFQLNDVLRMILETMYRGIGFTRVLLCVRDAGSNSLKARFGLGADVDQIVRRGFHVPLAATRDAFYAAISSGADVHIENVNAESIREHIPDWYRKLVPSVQSIALFPVMVNKKPVALFYGDSDHAGRLAFDAGELNLLKTLRNQAVLAIRQRS